MFGHPILAYENDLMCTSMCLPRHRKYKSLHYALNVDGCCQDALDNLDCLLVKLLTIVVEGNSLLTFIEALIYLSGEYINICTPNLRL